ncbi:Cj0814 family flagellar-dependent secreted protein, partial [Campylobacter aviculae]
LSMYHKIDIAKAIGNAYKVLSQLMPQTSNSSLSKEELANMPYAFSVDKNLNVTKTYTFEEYNEVFKTVKQEGYLTFNTMKDLGLGYGVRLMPINADSIFNSDYNTYIDKSVYKHSDGSVDKGGVLMAFLNNTNIATSFGAAFLRGET